MRGLTESTQDGWFKKTVELLNPLYEKMEKEGFAALCAKHGQGSDLPGNLAMPRREELFACLNRYRKLLF